MKKKRIRRLLAPTPVIPRQICYSCWRPSGHCLCAAVKPFKAHCNFLILQHPHERKKYYSTAKLVLKSIINSELARGIVFDTNALFAKRSIDKTYLLYPSADALDCADLKLDDDSTVIVIDGTWREARKIIYRNPELKKLPAISFKAAPRSQYKIRKQPKEYCLSTLESVGHLLKSSATAFGRSEMIEDYDSLFKLFSEMVDKQFSFFPRNH